MNRWEQAAAPLFYWRDNPAMVEPRLGLLCEDDHGDLWVWRRSGEFERLDLRRPAHWWPWAHSAATGQLGMIERVGDGGPVRSV